MMLLYVCVLMHVQIESYRGYRIQENVTNTASVTVTQQQHSTNLVCAHVV